MVDHTISVIIPNLHSPLIDQVVAALERQTVRARIREIIVVGQDRYGRVPTSAQFVATEQPISPAAARNLGAKHASSDYLLFLDADCLAAPDLVERLAAQHAHGRAVVGGSMAIEPSNYWVLCDNLLSFTAVLAQAPAGTRPYLPSFNFSISRALFERVGGFDERFLGAAGEDIDLSLRLIAAGYALYFEPNASVTHHPARVSARAMAQHLRMFGRAYYGVQRQHIGSTRSALARLPASFAGLIIALSPLLACRDVLLLYQQSREMRRHPHAFAGMLWGRMGWYLGVVEALLIAGRDPGIIESLVA
jgi:cellulose synthase/poly-beta-1,6-N-acetylglucosamine synthase-like glycosyltransferase